MKKNELLGEKTWSGEQVRHGVLFENLEMLLEETGVRYADISLYAVGRGPGSFSGMRMSFSAVRALALPGKNEVRAVGSGAALALQTVQELNISGPVAVAGDARRGQVWFAVFDQIGKGKDGFCADWKLVPYDQVEIPENTAVVSPDAERLKEWIPCLTEPRFPTARYVAELAQIQREPEPFEPLYMHPPVFVKPKAAG